MNVSFNLLVLSSKAAIPCSYLGANLIDKNGIYCHVPLVPRLPRDNTHERVIEPHKSGAASSTFWVSAAALGQFLGELTTWSLPQPIFSIQPHRAASFCQLLSDDLLSPVTGCSRWPGCLGQSWLLESRLWGYGVPGLSRGLSPGSPVQGPQTRSGASDQCWFGCTLSRVGSPRRSGPHPSSPRSESSLLALVGQHDIYFWVCIDLGCKYFLINGGNEDKIEFKGLRMALIYMPLQYGQKCGLVLFNF